MWIGEIIEHIRPVRCNSVIAVLYCQLSPRGNLLGADVFQLEHLLSLREYVLNVLQSAILETRHEIPYYIRIKKLNDRL